MSAEFLDSGRLPKHPPNAFRALLQVRDELLVALQAIANIGGNLTDEQLESRTGANDAVSRGIKLTSARSIARAAIAKAGAQ